MMLGGPNAQDVPPGIAKDLSHLNRIRAYERTKKRRIRSKTAELLRQLDALLPPPPVGRPRTLLETLSEASAAAARARPAPAAPPALRAALLSHRGAGLLVLDPALAVLDASPRMLAVLAASSPPRGAPARALLRGADGEGRRHVEPSERRR